VGLPADRAFPESLPLREGDQQARSVNRGGCRLVAQCGKTRSPTGSLKAAGGTPYREFVKERLEQAGRTPGLTNRRPRPMITSVREGSRFGSCNLLGELVAETSTRYIYRRRHTSQTAFVDKGSPSIHIEPCQACRDYRNAHR
jgi:hypothetical protein